MSRGSTVWSRRATCRRGPARATDTSATFIAGSRARLDGRVTEPSSNLGRYRVRPRSARAAWASSTARGIRSSRAPSRSRSCTRAGDDAAVRARLVREAQSLARLSHPNVCHVYDVGTESDEVWVAMELIDGVTLREWADGAHAARGCIARAARRRRGHRGGARAPASSTATSSPRTCSSTRDGRAVVTDFGLARLDDHVDPQGATTASTDRDQTATGAIAGTPAYLAPEQLTGASARCSRRSVRVGRDGVGALDRMRPFPIVAGARLDAIRAGITPPPTLPSCSLLRSSAAWPQRRAIVFHRCAS